MIIIIFTVIDVMEEEVICQYRLACHTFWNINHRRYRNHKVEDNTGQRKTSNVCFIYSVVGHYEQHCHVAIYQFKDLVTLFGVQCVPTN